jgi:hypothetical protein
MLAYRLKRIEEFFLHRYQCFSALLANLAKLGDDQIRCYRRVRFVHLNAIVVVSFGRVYFDLDDRPDFFALATQLFGSLRGSQP